MEVMEEACEKKQSFYLLFLFPLNVFFYIIRHYKLLEFILSDFLQ